MDSLWKKAQERLSDADLKLFKFHRPDSERREILEDILKAVQTQSDQCLLKRWKIKGRGGKEIVIRDVCGKMLNWVNQFLIVIDVAAQYDPIHASLPWAGVRFFLQLSLNDVKEFDAMIEGLETVSRVVTRYGLVEILYLKGTSDAQKQLKEQLTNLYATVLRYLCRARKYYSYSTAARIVVTALRPPELDEALKQIIDQEVIVRGQTGLIDSERQANLGVLAANTKIAVQNVDTVIRDIQSQLQKLDAPLVRTISQISALQAHLDNERKTRILSWLSRVPYRKHHAALFSDIVQESGQWLVSHPKYVDWKVSSSSQILWLNGPLGCGKTRLISATLNVLQDEIATTTNAAPLAFFYCSKASAEPERADPCQILRAITKQLSHPNGQAAVLQLAVNRYGKKCTEAERDGLDPSNLTIAECVDLILELTSTTSATIIIDALDECESSKRYQILEALENIVRSSRNVVEVLISSQRASDIDAKFSGHDQIAISATETHNDLIRFIDLQVDSVIKSGCLTPGRVVTQDLRKHVAGVLKSDAHGSFRYLQSLPDYASLNVHKRLARTCLTTLINSPGSSNDLLNEYASIFWAFHQESAGGTDSATSGLLSTFLFEDEHLDNWLDSLDLLQLRTRLDHLSGNLISRLHAARSTPISPLFVIACFGFCDMLKTKQQGAQNVDWDQLNDLGASAVYLASRSNHLNTVQYLIDHGSDVNIRGGQYETALQVAAYRGHEAMVVKLLNNGAMSSGSGNGLFSNALHTAIAGNHDSISKLVIDHGFQFLDQKSYDTCCNAAAFGGQVATVQLLLDKFAGNFTLQTVHDPLQVALYGRKEKLAKSLLPSYGDINQQVGYFGNAFQAAVCGGKLSLVELLADYGARLDQRGRYGYPLRAAAVSGHEDIVQWLLVKHQTDPNVEDHELGDTLQAAASIGSAEIVVLLLHHGAKIGGSRGIYGSPIKAASASGHLKVVQILVENGATIDRGVLTTAVMAGEEEITRFLINKKGAVVNSPDWLSPACFSLPSKSRRAPLPNRQEPQDTDIYQAGPLAAAASRRDLTMMSLLLNSGVELDAGSPSESDSPFQIRCTALQVAAYYGSEKVVKYLLDQGANLHTPRKVFGSALYAALEASHLGIATLLLGRGANIDHRWGQFGTCLQIYRERGDLHTVEYLHNHGANINDNGGQNGNALQVAASTGKLDVIQFLLRNGAEVDGPGKELGSAMQAAARGGHVEVVQSLHEAGASVNASGPDGDTALRVASANGHTAVVQFLLVRGASVNTISTLPTPLQAAAAGGYLKIVNLLLEHGADTHVLTPRIGSALHVAAFHGHMQIVQVLVGYGADTSQEQLIDYSLVKSYEDGESYDGIRLDAHLDALSISAYKRHTSIVEFLLSNDSLNGTSMACLYKALGFSIVSKNLSMVKLISNHADWTQVNSQVISTLLCLTCQVGSSDILEWLLLKFAGTGSPWPPQEILSDASTTAVNGDLGLVKLLVKAGADVSKLPGAKQDLLYRLIYSCDQDELDFVRSMRLDLRAIVSSLAYPNMLKEAMQNRNAEVLEWLLGLVHPSTDYLELCMPLMVTAAEKGFSDEFRILLDALPTSRQSPRIKYELVLAWCRSPGSTTEDITFVLEALGPLDDRSLSDCISAAFQCRAILVLQVLVRLVKSRGLVSTDAPTEFDMDKMLLLAIDGHNSVDLAQVFLEAGANANLITPDRESCLYMVCRTSGSRQGAHLVVQALLRSGADVTKAIGSSGTALHAALLDGCHPETVRVLLDAGMDVDCRFGSHGTPLHVAAGVKTSGTVILPPYRQGDNGYSATAKILLDHDADYRAKDEHGLTALEIALAAQNQSVVRLLLQSGALAIVNGEKYVHEPDESERLFLGSSNYEYWMSTEAKYCSPSSYEKLTNHSGLETGLEMASTFANPQLQQLVGRKRKRMEKHQTT
ncbi:hypothetical protein D6C92_08177 [Aureobasidium pullulans]|nr:hypothetical protein D6C92_08177 [Aureobasidium pullulans]